MTDLPAGFETAFIALLGLIFGSFAMVLIYRIPREIPVGLFSRTRSFCPKCEKKIPAWRNIPLLAFFLAKGRCGECGEPISRRYPLVEALCSVLFVITFEVYRRSPSMPMEDTIRWVELVKNLYFTFSLLVIVFIDLDFRIIPDRFSIGNWVIAGAAAVLWGYPSWIEALFGCLFGFGSFWLMAWGYEKWKGVEGLGFGDVKMMGWLGAWLGIFAVPFVILTASLSGLVAGLLTMRRSGDGLQTAIPFGPFLALGAYVAWILLTLGIW